MSCTGNCWVANDCNMLFASLLLKGTQFGCLVLLSFNLSHWLLNITSCLLTVWCFQFFSYSEQNGSFSFANRFSAESVRPWAVRWDWWRYSATNIFKIWRSCWRYKCSEFCLKIIILYVYWSIYLANITSQHDSEVWTRLLYFRFGISTLIFCSKQFTI